MYENARHRSRALPRVVEQPGAERARMFPRVGTLLSGSGSAAVERAKSGGSHHLKACSRAETDAGP